MTMDHKKIFFSLLFLIISSRNITAIDINPILTNPKFDTLFEQASNLSLKYLQREAARRLLVANSSKFEKELIKKITTGKTIEKQTSLRIMGRSGSLIFENQVINSITRDNFLVKERAAKTLYLIYCKLTNKELLSRLITKTNNKPFIQSAILCALANNNYQITERNKDLFFNLIPNQDKLIQKSMFEIILKQKSKKVKTTFKEKLDSLLETEKRYNVRSSIAEILHIFGNQEAATLRILLNENEPFVQIAAAYSLTMAGDSNAINLLHRALQTNNPSLQLATLEYLKKIKSPFSEPPITNLLNSKNNTVIIRAIEALEKLQGKAISQGLRKLLNSNNPEISSAAAITLQKQGALGIHWRFIEKLKDKNSSTVISAINTLAKLGSKQAIHPLQNLLFSEDEIISATSAIAIGKLLETSDENKNEIKSLQLALGRASITVAIMAADSLQKITKKPYLSNPKKAYNSN